VKRFLSVTSTDYPHSSASLQLNLDPPPQRLKALPREDVIGIASAMPQAAKTTRLQALGVSASSGLKCESLP
jgi:hypothetical protein